MNSSPQRREKIDVSLMVQSIADFKKEFNIKLVVFAGGEPTLMKGALLAAIAKCRELQIVSRMVTNASWAINDAKATAVCSSLYRAGLNEINISCDDYHLPDIPFERVKVAWKAAKKFPFASIIIANASGTESIVTPEFICTELGEDIPYRFSDDGTDHSGKTFKSIDGTTLGLSNASLQRLGRGNKNFFDKDVVSNAPDEVLNMPCSSAIRMPAITPDGNVVACCGFELSNNPVLNFGSISKSTAKNLIDKANDNVVARIIGTLGPGFLVKFVKSIEPSAIQDREYAGVCEACQDVITNKTALDVLHRNKVRLTAIVDAIDAEINSVHSAESF